MTSIAFSPKIGVRGGPISKNSMSMGSGATLLGVADTIGKNPISGLDW